MTLRVDVEPALLLWACERRRVAPDDLASRFPRLSDWIDGDAKPTLRQLESFAAATYTPVGYLFLGAPPQEPLPIPDLRTIASRPVSRPSADLLDTIYVCQQRQDWYRDYARAGGAEPLDFVGSRTTRADVEEVANDMRAALGFDLAERREMRTWEEALRGFVEQAEEMGVLVMVSGIVGSNTRRKLDPKEFRGFAMTDPLAPLVFVNGADSRSARMFTLAHELAHIWLGDSALSDASVADFPTATVERWCNLVAAELLVPLSSFRADLTLEEDLASEVPRLARVFKVSTLVIIRRLCDAGAIDAQTMWQLYRAEVGRLRSLKRPPSGGNYYAAQRARVGRRFARAVYTSTWEGRSSFTEAFRLLNVKKMATFKRLGRAVGVSA